MGPLESPYIVGYYDSFIDEQKINIVIEYCSQGDLNRVVEKQKILGKPFVDNLIWKIFIHIALGIEYLHTQNIIHRDLKSLNIFMVKDGVAKVGDLGCAKKIEEDESTDTQPQDNLMRTKSMSVIETSEDVIMNKLDDNPFDVIDDELLTGN
jgi:NIMA (never in mitosis gene a)-related kinase